MTTWTLLGLALLAAVLAAGISRFVQRATVFEYQHAIRFVRGRFAGVLSPGVHRFVAGTLKEAFSQTARARAPEGSG